jgi:hypothetical protein
MGSGGGGGAALMRVFWLICVLRLIQYTLYEIFFFVLSTDVVIVLFDMMQENTRLTSVQFTQKAKV